MKRMSTLSSSSSSSSSSWSSYSTPWWGDYSSHSTPNWNDWLHWLSSHHNQGNHWSSSDSTTSWPWRNYYNDWGTSSTYFPNWYFEYYDYSGHWWHDYYLWDWNEPHHSLWYMQHFTFSSLSFSVAQIFGALLSLFFNISLIVMALTIKDVPKMALFPMILHAFFNIFCNGLVNLASTSFTLVAHHMYWMDGPWSNSIKEFLYYNPGLVCARDYMLLIMSEYSTGFCILAMAVERFACVCANSRSTSRALKITRRLICLSLTVVVSLLLGVAAYASYASYNPYSCLAHFYGHLYYRVVIDGFIFFLGPAMMAGCLYALVGMELISKECELRKRDKILTLGFVASYGIWVFLWTPKWTYELMTLHQDVYNYFTAAPVLELWGTVYIPWQLLYSLLNPAIVMLVVFIAGRVGKQEKEDDREEKLIEKGLKEEELEGTEKNEEGEATVNLGQGAVGWHISDEKVPEKLRLEWETQLNFNSPTFH